VRIKSLLFLVMSILALLLGFQNCGTSTTSSSSKPLNSDDSILDNETTKTISSTEGDTVALGLSAEKVRKLFRNAKITCSWSYESLAGEILEIPVTENIYTLDKIEINESGTYTMNCKSATYEHEMVFILKVGNKANGGDTGKKAAFVFTVKYGTTDVTTHNGLTQEQSKRLCTSLKNAIPEVAGYSCSWNAGVFESRAETIIKGILKIVFYSKAVEISGMTISDISRSSAITKCDQESVKNSKVAIKCTWNDELILARAEPVKGTLKVYVVSATLDLTSTLVVDSIYEDSARTKCVDYDKKELSQIKHVICTWNSKKIYERKP
jgi:hypothetical protein